MVEANEGEWSRLAWGRKRCERIWGVYFASNSLFSYQVCNDYFSSIVEDILTNPKFAPVFLLIEKCPFLPELDVDAFANVFENMLGGGRDEDGRLQQPEKVLVALSVLPSSRRMRERTRVSIYVCT